MPLHRATGKRDVCHNPPALSVPLHFVFPRPLLRDTILAMLTEHEIEIRVRYQETDGQGRLHHANYFTYFEMGRTEMLRASGLTYRKCEEEGWMLVVWEITCKYHQPAFYDDVLRLRTKIVESQGAKIIHEYQVFRDQTLLAKGRSTLACIDRQGRAQRIPDLLTFDPDEKG
jgi:acyl-CoA thioester hydrolase